MARRTIIRRRSKGPSRTKRNRSFKTVKIPSDDRLEVAFGFLREGRTQKRAAEIAGISVRRFRNFLRSDKLAEFNRGHWRITDRRVREVVLMSDGQGARLQPGVVGDAPPLRPFAQAG